MTNEELLEMIDRARELYRCGWKTIEIADHLGIPITRVHRWRGRQGEALRERVAKRLSQAAETRRRRLEEAQRRKQIMSELHAQPIERYVRPLMQHVELLELIDRARELYRCGWTTIEIADHLGIPVSRARRWCGYQGAEIRERVAKKVERIAEIRRRLEEGQSTEQIMREVHCHRLTVTKVRAAYFGQAPTRRTLWPLWYDLVIEKYRAGQNPNSIARELGLCYRSVYRWCRRSEAASGPDQDGEHHRHPDQLAK